MDMCEVSRCSPGADVAGGEPSPGADVAGVSPVVVQGDFFNYLFLEHRKKVVNFEERMAQVLNPVEGTRRNSVWALRKCWRVASQHLFRQLMGAVEHLHSKQRHAPCIPHQRRCNMQRTLPMRHATDARCNGH